MESKMDDRYGTTDKKLTELPWFRISLVVPAVSAIIAATVIIFNTNLSWNLSSEGFNNVLVVFRFPLAVAALALPWSAFVATTHRSIQAACQIENSQLQLTASRKQNTFSNFYKHRDVFFEFLVKLEKELKIEFVNSTKLYKKLFPDNSTTYVETKGGGSSSRPLLKVCSTKYSDLICLLETKDATAEHVVDVCRKMYMLNRKLRFVVKDGQPLVFKDFSKRSSKRKKILIIDSEGVESPVPHLVIVAKVIKRLSIFCEVEVDGKFKKYKPSKNFRKALEDQLVS